jgi:hypothetical protein
MRGIGRFDSIIRQLKVRGPRCHLEGRLKAAIAGNVRD